MLGLTVSDTVIDCFQQVERIAGRGTAWQRYVIESHGKPSPGKEICRNTLRAAAIRRLGVPQTSPLHTYRLRVRAQGFPIGGSFPKGWMLPDLEIGLRAKLAVFTSLGGLWVL